MVNNGNDTTEVTRLRTLPMDNPGTIKVKTRPAATSELFIVLPLN